MKIASGQYHIQFPFSLWTRPYSIGGGFYLTDTDANGDRYNDYYFISCYFAERFTYSIREFRRS